MNKIQRELYSKIQEASNIIRNKSRRGASSWMITSSKIMDLFKIDRTLRRKNKIKKIFRNE